MSNDSDRDISNNIIEAINDNLLRANVISDCREDTFPNVKLLTNTWQESSKKKAKGIKALSKIDLEFHWNFLVKPHSHWLMLRCLVNTTSHLLLTLKNALFTAHTCIYPHHPPQLMPITYICEL